MKLITGFGLVSALLLLSVSTILVVKQNRFDDLTSEDFECLGVRQSYDVRHASFFAYFSNTCQQPKKFLIVYENQDQKKVQYETGCLLSGATSGIVTIPWFNPDIYEVQTSNCD